MLRHRVLVACLALLVAGCGLLPGGEVSVHASDVEPTDLAPE